MDPVTVFVKCLLIPGLVAGLFAVGSVKGPAALRPLIAALGVAVSWMVAQTALAGRMLWPPVEGPHFILWASILFAFGGAAEGIRLQPRVMSALRRLPLFAGLLYLMGRPLIDNSWSSDQTTGYLVGGSLALLAGGMGSAEAARRGPPAAAVGALALSAGVGAAALGATGSVIYGQLGGMIATALGLFGLLSLRVPDPGVARAVVAAGYPIFAGMLVSGVLFSELPLAAALPIGLAPLGGMLERPERAGLPYRALGSALVLAVIGLVVGLVISGSGAADDGYGAY